MEVDLSHLYKLENLRCQSDLNEDGSCFLNKLGFPHSIRKLTIFYCVVFRSFLATLCGLPNLEVLSICQCVFERNGEADEEEWEMTEGDEFRSLQCLCLDSLNIARWRANKTNFPKLLELHVKECNELYWKHPNPPNNFSMWMWLFCSVLGARNSEGSARGVRQLRHQIDYTRLEAKR